MIELIDDDLVFRFPEVHKDAVLSITFQRTLRIPDDNRDYPLPPGLGNFPLLHVDDYANRHMPASWQEHGGVFFPMSQAEAMWISFSADYPMAVKIAAGKINAVTGKQWTNDLSRRPQDYMVTPDQPWLDGFTVKKGLIRQFVAMPLGAGYTAEEQLSGAAEHGGIQIIVYPLKAEIYEEEQRELQEAGLVRQAIMYSPLPDMAVAEMGLAPGGLMRQEIYKDERGLDEWDTSTRARCFAHILNSAQYHALTGMAPPAQPPTAMDYANAGLPWFEYYDDALEALEGSSDLAGLDSVAAKSIKQGDGILTGNDAVEPTNVARITARRHNRVREAKF